MATILIVDDRQLNRKFLVALLGHEGHRMLEAVDGADALRVVRNLHPDLVSADILMPTTDGYEFARQLRADPAIAGTRIVFCTAHYHEQEALTLATDCGVLHVLTKPCEPERLLHVVDAALGFKPAAAPASPKEDFDQEHLRLMTDKLAQQGTELRTANLRFAALIEVLLQFTAEHKTRGLLDLSKLFWPSFLRKGVHCGWTVWQGRRRELDSRQATLRSTRCWAHRLLRRTINMGGCSLRTGWPRNSARRMSGWLRFSRRRWAGFTRTAVCRPNYNNGPPTSNRKSPCASKPRGK